jgi:hypothetical protein
MARDPEDGTTDDLFGLVSPPPLPRKVARLIEASAAIQDAPPARSDFLHTVLCQDGVLRSNRNGPDLEGTTGYMSLCVETGGLYGGTGWGQQPLTALRRFCSCRR